MLRIWTTAQSDNLLGTDDEGFFSQVSHKLFQLASAKAMLLLTKIYTIFRLIIFKQLSFLVLVCPFFFDAFGVLTSQVCNRILKTLMLFVLPLPSTFCCSYVLWAVKKPSKSEFTNIFFFFTSYFVVRATD